jgi:hypothetical protein
MLLLQRRELITTIMQATGVPSKIRGFDLHSHKAVLRLLVIVLVATKIKRGLPSTSMGLVAQLKFLQLWLTRRPRRPDSSVASML